MASSGDAASSNPGMARKYKEINALKSSLKQLQVQFDNQRILLRQKARPLFIIACNAAAPIMPPPPQHTQCRSSWKPHCPALFVI